MTYNEDEQVEQLKRFWNDYGTGLLLTVALVLAAFAGWRVWEKSRLDAATIATSAYQDMGSALQKLQSDPTDKTSNTDLQKNAQKLMTEYAGTPYAINAGLLLAKHAIQSNNLPEATKQLQWVLTQKPDEGVRIITTVRLARIKAASGDNAGALALLVNENNEAFAPLVDEARGDFDVALNKQDDARTAYAAADAALAKREEPANPLLEMKLASVGLTPVDRDTDKAAAK